MTVPLQDESFMTHAVSTWADTVYRVALTRMRSPCDAEDVVQDVFVSLMRSARRFEDDEHLKAWLITATINRCRSLARAPWAKRVSLDDELAERKLRYGAGSDAAYVHAREHPLWSAVDELPDGMRSAFHLYYVEGYATADIAKLMSCKPATVRSWLHRARKILKLNLNKEGRHEQPKHARIRQSHEASPAGR